MIHILVNAIGLIRQGRRPTQVLLPATRKFRPRIAHPPARPRFILPAFSALPHGPSCCLGLLAPAPFPSPPAPLAPSAPAFSPAPPCPVLAPLCCFIFCHRAGLRQTEAGGVALKLCILLIVLMLTSILALLALFFLLSLVSLVVVVVVASCMAQYTKIVVVVVVVVVVVAVAVAVALAVAGYCYYSWTMTRNLFLTLLDVIFNSPDLTTKPCLKSLHCPTLAEAAAARILAEALEHESSNS